MVTPKIYTANLRKGIITNEMLASAIYSVNKRAKNARYKECEYRREYRNRYDYYGNEERARERKEYYEAAKDVEGRIYTSLNEPTMAEFANQANKIKKQI